MDYSIVWQSFGTVVVYLLCCNKNSPPPILTFEFIHRLVDVITSYFGSLSIAKITTNNDTLTLLINEMIDEGIPITTDPNQLKDLIPFKSLFSKILTSANTLTSTTPKTQVASETSSTSTVPWRRSNVRYTNNEMYVDVEETINVILKPSTSLKSSKLLSSKSFDSAFYSFKSQTHLVPIVGTIDGQINLLTHLTGAPQLLLNLSIPNLKLLPSFHRCVELSKWASNRSLSFIPPDGLCTLMNYQIDLDASNSYFGLIEVDYQSGLGVMKNEFEIRLFIKEDKQAAKIENLTLEIYCAASEGEDKDVNDSSVTSMKTNRVTHGDFSYKGNGKAEWNLRSVATGTQASLHGTLLTNNLDAENPFESEGTTVETNVEPIEPIYVKMNYQHKGSVPSGLKVDGLKVVSSRGMPDAVKPYKGVKYTTKTGDFIIRT